MSIHPRDWRGYFAASPTPFTEEGHIDFRAMGEVLSWLMSCKPHGVVLNGTTGEWYSQSIEERKAVLEFGRSLIPSSTPLLVGISSLIPEESVALGKHAQEVGADGLMLTAPPGRRLTDAEVVNYFSGITEKLALPLMIYNVPSAAGYDLSTDLMSRLLEIEGVVGIKDNTASFDARKETLTKLGPKCALFSDIIDPQLFEYAILNGLCRGQIGSGMPLGYKLTRIFELAWSGDTEKALKYAALFQQFKADITSLYGNGQAWHAEMKAIMLASGVDAGFPIFPKSTVRNNPAEMARLQEVLRPYLDVVPE